MELEKKLHDSYKSPFSIVLFNLWGKGGTHDKGQCTRGPGLSPPSTFWDLLSRSFFQIAQKRNKKLHEKNIPPEPLHFSDGSTAPSHNNFKIV